METFAFSALGTQWSILVDHEHFLESHKKAMLDAVAVFEHRFSRFLPESEVNQFREASAGTYVVSDEFASLLTAADRLRTLTGGVYDPAVGGLLEHAGYDKEYRMEPDEEVENYTLPQWSLSEKKITIGGPVVFDFGGIGKGYCIDLIAELLKKQGYTYFLVEGGGDMYGTTKRDGSAYRIALEWPGKPDTAFGVVELRNQGVAVSDSFKRRWPASAKAGRDEKNWHHIIDPQSKKPIEQVVGCTALAQTAFAADCMTSALFLSSSEKYPGLSEQLQAEYVVFKQDGSVEVSQGWGGELF